MYNFLMVMIFSYSMYLAASFNIEPLQGSNKNFKFVVVDSPYVLRISKNSAILGINREQEITYYKMGEQLGIAPRLIAANAAEGLLISQYIENYNTFEKMHTPAMIRKIISTLKMLHAYRIDEPSAALISTVFARNDRILESAKQLGVLTLQDNELIRSWMQTRKSFEEGYYAESATPCVCHGDLYYRNILEDEQGKVYLIDWEYAFYGYPIDDLGKLCAGNEYTDQEIMNVVREYYLCNDQTYFVKIKQNIFMRQFSMYIWCLIQASCNPERQDYFEEIMSLSKNSIICLQEFLDRL